MPSRIHPSAAPTEIPAIAPVDKPAFPPDCSSWPDPAVARGSDEVELESVDLGPVDVLAEDGDAVLDDKLSRSEDWKFNWNMGAKKTMSCTNVSTAFSPSSVMVVVTSTEAGKVVCPILATCDPEQKPVASAKSVSVAMHVLPFLFVHMKPLR